MNLNANAAAGGDALLSLGLIRMKRNIQAIQVDVAEFRFQQKTICAVAINTDEEIETILIL